jgi:hypothetical protein
MPHRGLLGRDGSGSFHGVHIDGGTSCIVDSLLNQFGISSTRHLRFASVSAQESYIERERTKGSTPRDRQGGGGWSIFDRGSPQFCIAL